MVKVISYGIITTDNNSTKRVAAKIENKIVDLIELCQSGILDTKLEIYFLQDSINKFTQLDKSIRAEIKSKVLAAIDKNNIVSHSQNHMPVKIGGYTDFYASIEHATNIGKIFRPDAPLLPNWIHLPIAYNGRASSVMMSGYPLKRPSGQILVDGKPEFSVCKKVDIEVELGVIIGKNSKLGKPIEITEASDYIFGICVVNDWSLRDIQAWEYQPLGPFTSKSVLTSIASFIIPLEELEPFKVDLKPQQKTPFAYLDDKNAHTYDIKFDVKLKTEKSSAAEKISEVNFKDIYWSMKQMIAQHTITGCNLSIGDLIASGTISGKGLDHAGSLMEITINGTKPITLSNGETRSFLLDGDEVIIEAYNDTNGVKIDLGSVVGKVIT
jgi:fumarylacetoacetase